MEEKILFHFSKFPEMPNTSKNHPKIWIDYFLLKINSKIFYNLIRNCENFSKYHSKRLKTCKTLQNYTNIIWKLLGLHNFLFFPASSNNLTANSWWCNCSVTTTPMSDTKRFLPSKSWWCTIGNIWENSSRRTAKREPLHPSQRSKCAVVPSITVLSSWTLYIRNSAPWKFYLTCSCFIVNVNHFKIFPYFVRNFLNFESFQAGF